MKKIIFLLLIIFLGASAYYFYNNIYLSNQKKIIEIEQRSVTITKYYIYGTHLNIEGHIKKINAKFNNAKLILRNIKTGKIKTYKINYNKNINNIDFNISDEINRGIYLDDINKGNYELFLRLSYEEQQTYKYYPLNNTTSYEKIVYYTTSKNNNKIIISKNNNTMTINVNNNTDNNIYDIVIDPAAGGIDKGVSGNGYNESNITLEYATKIKEALEQKKIKVKLTRTKDSLKEDEYFKEYNDGGRAVIAREVNAKYLISLTANSSTNKETNGMGISTAVNINYDFATNIVENIINKTAIKTATSTYHRIDYGIYSHNFTESEIKQNMEYYDKKGYKRYNVTTSSNYLYMIRESGGIITGAYIDDSNPEKIGVNKYYNSNIGVEAYVINLGYLTNAEDISIITNKKDEYIEAISNSIIEELKP